MKLVYVLTTSDLDRDLTKPFEKAFEAFVEKLDYIKTWV